jgi:hypothetical protein
MPSTTRQPIFIDSDDDSALQISPSLSNSEPAAPAPDIIGTAPVVPEHFKTYRANGWGATRAVSLKDIELGEFLTWWSATPWAKNNTKNAIIWDDSKRKANFWEWIIPVARATDGKPFCLCTICKSVLEHPNVKNGGTSGYSKHLKSQTCIHAAKAKGVLAGPLEKFLSQNLEPQVSDYYFAYYFNFRLNVLATPDI